MIISEVHLRLAGLKIPIGRPCAMAPAFYDISSISDSDLARVVPVAIVVIGLLLCLVVRSGVSWRSDWSGAPGP